MKHDQKLKDFIETNKVEITLKVVTEKDSDKKSLRILGNKKMKKYFHRYCRPEIEMKKAVKKLEAKELSIGETFVVKSSKIVKLVS